MSKLRCYWFVWYAFAIIFNFPSHIFVVKARAFFVGQHWVQVGFLGHVFPRLEMVVCFHTLVLRTVTSFPAFAWHQVHVSSLFARVTCFPALGTGYRFPAFASITFFSLPLPLLLVFPRSAFVAWFYLSLLSAVIGWKNFGNACNVVSPEKAGLFRRKSEMITRLATFLFSCPASEAWFMIAGVCVWISLSFTVYSSMKFFGF